MLPTGLTLDSSTGEISGTVDAGVAPGDYPVTFKMCDENSDGICCQKQMTITVGEACGVLPVFDSSFSSGLSSPQGCAFQSGGNYLLVGGGSGTDIFILDSSAGFAFAGSAPLATDYTCTNAAYSPGTDKFFALAAHGIGSLVSFAVFINGTTLASNPVSLNNLVQGMGTSMAGVAVGDGLGFGYVAGAGKICRLSLSGENVLGYSASVTAGYFRSGKPAVDSSTGKVYSVRQKDTVVKGAAVDVFDGTSLALLSSIVLPESPSNVFIPANVTFCPDNGLIYVTLIKSLYVINPATESVVTSFFFSDVLQWRRGGSYDSVRKQMSFPFLDTTVLSNGCKIICATDNTYLGDASTGSGQITQNCFLDTINQLGFVITNTGNVSLFQ